MVDLAKEIIPVTLEDELKQSYLAYAMSVIVGRALPDVRDGLKPVHRRVLYAMHVLQNDWNKPYKKSARVVGDVIGKYHPHGEVAVYDTIVRMAQPFSMRCMLVDGQGNFGSVDGDPPAAMRYTEIRLAKIAHLLLADLEKETVDFAPNYDETEFAPSVLPTKLPNLLINGSSGIAVGMATNIPPHNLAEVIDACVAMLLDPQIDTMGLMEYIPGPDFPTAAIINGRAGIVQAYQTGRGRVVLRARTNIEEDKKTGKQTIIVTELPYQVNKARLIEKIAELVKDKKLEGISELRDESDRLGMRIVIGLRRGEMAEVMLNNLYAHTALQSSFGVNMVALVDGQPRTLNLKQILTAFIRHRREVVTRRCLFDLAKAKARAHTLEGLGIALANIDAMIALIKSAKDPKQAKELLLQRHWNLGLVEKLLAGEDSNLSRPEDLPSIYGAQSQGYKLSPEQVKAILELRLHRLTALEQNKIISEYEQLILGIKDLFDILSNPDRLTMVIKEELLAVKQDFADDRRTEITAAAADLSMEDLIAPQEVVLTLSHEGYVKYQPLDVYQAQHRGGKGKLATTMKEEDFIEQLVVANTRDTILCFSNRGKVYWLRIYQLPAASRISRGKPIINVLPLAEDEKINTILPICAGYENQFTMMATAKGTVKKVALEQFSRPRSNGIIAVDLVEGDYLIGVTITDGNQEIMLFSNAGKAVRFKEEQIRTVGRTARGVRGIRLKPGEVVVSLSKVAESASEKGTAVLTVTENGYGKRTSIDEYSITRRGGVGVISIQVNERNGQVIGASQVSEQDEAMLITDRGTLVRFSIDEISLISRNTQGVRLIDLSKGGKVVGLQRIEEINPDIIQVNMEESQ